MPALHLPPSEFPALGELTVGTRLGVGGTSLDEFIPVREGVWRAYLLDEDTISDLVDDGVLPEDDDGEPIPQLLLVHGDRPLPSSDEVAALREVARFAIEAARFTVADAGLEETLASTDGFYDHLDGLEGVLANGRGVSASLSGDGRGVVWAEPGDAPGLVLVELH